MPTYIRRDGELVDKHTGEVLRLDPNWVPVAPLVMRDSPGIVSPIDGTWVEGRTARAEHMKKHGVVEAGDRKPLNDGYAKNVKFAKKHGLKY